MSLPWFVFGSDAHGGRSFHRIFMAQRLVFSVAAVVGDADCLAMGPVVPRLVSIYHIPDIFFHWVVLDSWWYRYRPPAVSVRTQWWWLRHSFPW